MTNSRWVTPIIYTVIFSIILAVNSLSSTTALNGVSTGELSDRYDSMITPAGFAFSIWGLIYLLLLLFIGRLWIAAIKNKASITDSYKRVLPFFILQGICNVAWLFSWHYEQVALSFILMLGLLSSLLIIYHQVVKEKLWVLPWSVYLGWISVATIVNASVLLITLGVEETSIRAEYATIIMVTIAAFLGLLFMVRRDDHFYPLVIVWALFFIASENRQEGMLYFLLLSFCTIIIISNIAYYLYRKKTIRT